MEQKQLLIAEYLIVRCLECGDKHTVEVVFVVMEPVYDPDDDTFIQYDIRFHDEAGETVYIEDLLCVNSRRNKRCSVFGKCDDGRMFAFPYLSQGRSVGRRKWHSEADRDGMHWAITRAKAAQ